MASPAQKRVNVVVSRLIPPVLLGAVIYASYAVTKPLCIDYLIHPLPSYDRGPRVGAGAAIIAIYYVLLIPMVVSYMCLYYQVLWNPGHLPLGEQKVADEEKSKQSKRRHGKKSTRKSDPEKTNQADADVERGSNSTVTGHTTVVSWVDVCAKWITFVLAEIRRQTGGVNPHWCVCIGLSGLFAFFTAGMTLSSVQMAIFNITTIENLNRRSAVWTLAIRVPEHLLERLWVVESPWAPTFRMVSYPLQAPSSPTESQPTNPFPGEERHVFAILHTLPGENPFDLGSPLKNFQQVMGYNVFDWMLPIKKSPCADHSSMESHFALGPVVTRLRLEAGLAPPENRAAYPQSPHSGRIHREKPPSDQ
ncbi:hypothetical protein PITC_077910 [Penicillium italicum]|uniref:Uncharacterized protein n=1 Tax=Penicillium italicum TaxID=40296 RepID=A0A0A2KWW2_PENIT|nr:hypothetical protein PITC_077910 [Penicillium italicum]